MQLFDILSFHLSEKLHERKFRLWLQINERRQIFCTLQTFYFLLLCSSIGDLCDALCNINSHNPAEARSNLIPLQRSSPLVHTFFRCIVSTRAFVEAWRFSVPARRPKASNVGRWGRPHDRRRQNFHGKFSHQSDSVLIVLCSTTCCRPDSTFRRLSSILSNRMKGGSCCVSSQSFTATCCGSSQIAKHYSRR